MDYIHLAEQSDPAGEIWRAWKGVVEKLGANFNILQTLISHRLHIDFSVLAGFQHFDPHQAPGYPCTQRISGAARYLETVVGMKLPQSTLGPVSEPRILLGYIS